MKIQKRQISVTLDAPVLNEIRTLAQKTDRTLSGYINYVLKTHIEQLHRNTD